MEEYELIIRIIGCAIAFAFTAVVLVMLVIMFKSPKFKKPSEDLLKKIHALMDKKGQFAAIEPKTGIYSLGETMNGALGKARKAFPGKFFYCIRIGYTAAQGHKGVIAN